DPDLADCAILDSAYSRLSEAIPGWWQFLGGRWLRLAMAPMLLLAWPMAGFNPFRVDVAAALSGFDGRRLLLVHGERDVLAPAEHARRNAAAAHPEAQILWMPDCDHSEGRWLHPTRFYDGVFGFLVARGILKSTCPSDDSTGGRTTTEECHDHA
ncbi:MAG: hypothetical protein WHU10_08500, partial [Fimbriimonadales bacterium]